jgi:hypothetical protein
MSAAFSPLAAQTEADFETKPEGNGVVITKYKGQGGTVTIPVTIGGKPVTSIGMWAFDGCSGLTFVTIPESVTRIGYGAFSGCSGLTPEVRADIEERFGIRVL